MLRSLTVKLAFFLLVILTVAGIGQTFRVLSIVGQAWASRQEELGGALLERARAASALQGSTGKLEREPLAGVLEEHSPGRSALRLYAGSGELLDWMGDLEGQPAIGPAELERLGHLGIGRARRVMSPLHGMAIGMRLDTGPDGPARYLVYSVSSEPVPWLRAGEKLARRNLVVSTLLASMAGLLLVRWLRRRLDALGKAFQQVAAGDLSTRVPEPRERELAGLARSFNLMASELERAQAERARAETQRRSFMAQASHELRTPLTSLQGYLETLTMDGLDLDEAQRRGYLDRAFLEAQELGHRVEDLLELVRLERPSFRLTPAEAELAEVFAELERRYQPLAASTGVQLQGLAEAPGLRAFWDRRRIVQALGNLLHNAIKASPRGGVVTVSAQPGPERIRIDIEDQGPGLAGYEDPSGLGLGLQIARALIEHHGGTLRLERREPVGLRAAVELPLEVQTTASA